MNRFPKSVQSVIRIIDTLSEWSGKIVGWLIIPLILGLTYEVIARYGFHAPTVWAYDIAYMLYGTLFMLGAVYTLKRNGHIRTDMLYDRWSPRRQGWVNVISYLFLFFPGMIFFFLSGLDVTIHSWIILEKSDFSPWRPPLYPFKTVIPLTALLLIVQGVSECLKSLHAALKGEWI
ncbi:MAG: TRAP transporter small permease subunit [Deltaproteobacteria bacterium]|nr:TRAP transporter small permease subunit [Deltaproteobacteria bacterium]